MAAPDIPPPPLNGGLYTGEPFAGPWRNYPVLPDAGYMMHVALQPSAPESKYHVPGGGLRPGNNTPYMPRTAVDTRLESLNLVCTPEASVRAGDEDHDNRGFVGHYYIY